MAEPPVAPPPAGVSEAWEDQPTVVKDELGGVVRPHQFRVIDLLHLGRERVIGCWQVEDVLIDPGPASCLATLLDALGDARPRALLLTHIHLDHAGAAGSLVERWPDLEVYVHERGAPHLMDPEKLLESARRLYGEDMERLWGEVLPVPVENVRILRGGEELLNGAFEVAYTPGHASHHVAYLHDGTAFVGDVAGVRITPDTLTIPPTPPPDVDVEAWHASIDRVNAWRPNRLAMTHFGSSEDVDSQLAELSERLDNLAALARTEEMDTFIATVVDEIKRDAGAELVPAYTQAAPPEQLYAGLRRYWDTRAEDENAAPAQASTHAGRFTRPPGSAGAGGSGEVS
jgi:glyoxylase-like metal-dependent hydrolase (beta-lactamase superfamily II)